MTGKLTHLLPCPFCGCTKVPKRQGNGIGDYWLECFECGASTRLREDGAGMEKDWNSRPAPTQQPSGEVTDSDIYTLLGHAELLRAEGQTDMPDWFLEFAWRLASGIDVTLAARVAEIRDSARAQGGKS